MRQRMDEEEIEYDIYFQGAREDLFTFLYPLTGPNSQIFDHLQLQGIRYDKNKMKFSFDHQPNQFTNIDRQTDKIVYQSVNVPTHSNYFYSKSIPGENALIWRNVKRMTQLRPSISAPQNNEKTVKKDKGMVDEGEEIAEDNGQLVVIKEQDVDNKVIKEIHDANLQPLNKNWDVSKNQYIARLCE